MKILVKPASAIHLLDPTNGQEIHWNRPSVIVNTDFVQTRIASGVLRVINNGLPESATDAEFAKFFTDSKGDEELAIQSFLSQFEPKEEVKEAPKVEPKLPEKKAK